MSLFKKISVCLTPLLFLGAPTFAVNKVPFKISPQIVKWSKGTALVKPLRVLQPHQATSGVAKELWDKFSKKLPNKKMPAEGYLLSSTTQGTIIIVADRDGLRWARQTLKELSDAYPIPIVQIADWPDRRLRAYHQLVYTPEAILALKRMVTEFLIPNRANMLILEIGYHFDFKKHPQVRTAPYWTRAQMKDFVKFCAAYGVRVVPELNSLGHQSWKADGIGGLLKAYPQFEEIPDATSPMTNLAGSQFYARSWCPLLPEVNKVVFDLYDELIEATNSRFFHIGADEVFVIGSKKCPRCRGKQKSELYAKAINDLYGHLKKRGQTVMMWGDRLLDDQRVKYGKWEASQNHTDGAIFKIPKDIIIADWHYNKAVQYPSLNIFTSAGFRVMPTTYQNPLAAKAFLRAADRAGDKVLGVIASVWFSALDAAATLFNVPQWKKSEKAGTPEAKTIMHTAKVTLVGGWNRKAMSAVQW